MLSFFYVTKRHFIRCVDANLENYSANEALYPKISLPNLAESLVRLV